MISYVIFVYVSYCVYCIHHFTHMICSKHVLITFFVSVYFPTIIFYNYVSQQKWCTSFYQVCTRVLVQHKASRGGSDHQHGGFWYIHDKIETDTWNDISEYENLLCFFPKYKYISSPRNSAVQSTWKTENINNKQMFQFLNPTSSANILNYRSVSISWIYMFY